jgi:uncharacterized protein YgiM (DUF1202 family)
MRAIASLIVAAALTGMFAPPLSAATSAPGVVPAGSLVQTVADAQMEVSGPYANLRAKPTTQAKLLAKLNHGTKVDIVGKVEHDHWYHVKVNGMDGYIRADLLK